MPAEHITSAANPLLKDIRKAQEQGSLTAQGWLIAEGPHLLEEVLQSHLRIRCVVAAEGYELAPNVCADRVVVVPARLFRSIAGTENPQGVLALAEPPVHDISALYRATALIVVLDGVQDPGNTGAIARSAEAFGATGLQFLEGTANPFHPKAVRASAGSLLRVPVVRSQRELHIRVPLYAGVADPRAPACWDRDLTGPCALVIGNEGAGVSADLLRRAQPVRVPTRGVESLNAAVAASLLLYEAARQRSVR